MNYTTLTTVIALAVSTLAGSMTAANLEHDRTRGQLDPMIIDILQQADINTTRLGLQPRVLNRAMKPLLGVQQSNTKLQVKFADDLRIRLHENGVAYSKTSRSISQVTSILEQYQLTLTPCIPAGQERIDALVARAEQQSRKQSPDLGGMYWIEGPSSSVAAAASALHRLDEVEWVFWNTVLDISEHTSNQLSIFSAQNRQAPAKAAQPAIRVRTAPLGACWLSERTCETRISSGACRALGGTYLGDNSVCEVEQDAEARGLIGACCYILLDGPPMGALLIPACLDTTNDGMDMATCQIINSTDPLVDPFVNTYVPGLPPPGHANGVWFNGEECDGISTDCAIPGGLQGPAGAYICGEANDPTSIFSGDCYHDQSDPALRWSNRLPTAFFPPATIAPGCWDARGFPIFAPIGFELQGCCTEVEIYDPSCATTLWDAECVSLANSSAFAGLCLNPTDLGGVSGDCGSPWGPNHRPYPVNINGPRGVQRMVVIASDGTISDRVIPFVGPYGCGGAGAFPGQPTYVPTTTTPDYYAFGLLPVMTDERLNLASITDSSLLQWPMCGGAVGDATYNTEFGVPLISGRGDSRWAGNGLNLFADQVSPSGIGNGDPYSGLYGLGLRRSDELGIADGTHGAGVQVAVLDYSAFIQAYPMIGPAVPTPVGGVHEDLLDVMLEGTDTGHSNVQMVFNPPDAPDYPLDFAQSPNHGTAQLGVIAASWNGPIPTDALPPTTNFGAMGIAPEATVAFFPLMSLQPSGGTGGRVETAWFNAMEWLRNGDVLSAGYVGLDAGTNFSNISFNPATHALIETATNLGISVVIAAGDTGTDLSLSTFPNDVDPGAIVVTAVTPGGAPSKRWADSVSASNFVDAAIDTQRNTCAAWGAGVTTCGMGPGQDNWLGYKTITYTDPADPVEVASRSYTNNYSGTSAAAAIVAGCVTSMQGYARQVFDTPISPAYIRQFIAHGQVLGNDPVTGTPIFSTINASGTNTNVAQGTENDKGTSPWGPLNWDYDDTVGTGGGNIVGYFADPRWACIRMTVDPLFDNPSVMTAMVLRGTWLQGAENSLATQDGITFGVNSEITPIGAYDLPGVVPGDSVFYSFSGETTDLYITGLATDLRGNPLLTLQAMTVEVTLEPTQAPTTMLQLWMWDYSTGAWRQPSPTAALGAGSTDQAFDVIRAGSLVNAAGRYHARFVSISAVGVNASYPIFYDQIRIVPTIPSTQP